MFAFEMTLDVAVEFYKRKQKLGANTEEQCTHILLQMAKEGLIKKVEVTDETKDQYIKRLAKTKKILHVKGRQNGNKTKGKANSRQVGTIGN